MDDRARVLDWLRFRLEEDDVAERAEFPDSFRDRGGGPEVERPTDERVGEGIGETWS